MSLLEYRKPYKKYIKVSQPNLNNTQIEGDLTNKILDYKIKKLIDLEEKDFLFPTNFNNTNMLEAYKNRHYIS